jgi:hypothetical protein
MPSGEFFPAGIPHPSLSAPDNPSEKKPEGGEPHRMLDKLGTILYNLKKLKMLSHRGHRDINKNSITG